MVPPSLAAVGLWARREVARRWAALVVLGVLAGLVGGLALAAVAGARRTETAYARFREDTGRSDAILFATLVGVFDADWDPVRALTEVEDAGAFALAPMSVPDPGLGQLAPNDDRLYRTVNRPLLEAGRLPDPDRSDEVLVNRVAAARYGLGVADRLTIVGDTALPWEPPGQDPVTVEATVVGVGDSNMDLVFGGQEEPGYVPSPALLAQHPEIPRATNLVVRLRPGTDVDAFGRRAAEAMGIPNLPVRDQAPDAKRVTRGTDLEGAALGLFAAAVALAGVVLVGQAVSRSVYASALPAPALRAVGITRGGLVAGLVLPLGVSAAASLGVTAATALVLSRLFPLGLAGRLEPDPGIHADWAVIAPGAALVAVAVLAGAATAALRATRARRPRAPAAGRRSLVATLARATSLPAAVGAGLALERGEGPRSLPVRPALASGVAAVLGVVGAFGLLHGIDDALARPEVSGQFWDAEVLPESTTMDDVLAALADDGEVGDIARMRLVDLEAEGLSVPTYDLVPVRGEASFTLLEGRAPAGPGEVVLGPATGRALSRAVGDTMAFGGGHTARVVGIGLLPQTPHFSFDQGAWLTAAGFDSAAPPEGDQERAESALVSFRPGQGVGAAVQGLTERLGPSAEITPSYLPQDVLYLRNVRTLPKALAAFLVVLGLAALGHVLVTAVRRRRHDLAVLRAIGLRPRQVASCVAWQAVTVSAVALVVGLPLGVAAGRWSWRWVADATPILYVPPVAAAVVIASVPVAVAVAELMAALPARQAARLRPAAVLRAE